MGERVAASLVHGRPRPDTTVSHHRAVQRVIAAMRERLDEELSLHEMAGVAFMSPFHFNRTFHHVIGMPPGRFLSALRLERARRLLLTTQERVTDVCFDVGYNSLGTFTRRFTDILGVSPRELRGFAAVTSPTAMPVAPPPLQATRTGAGLPIHGTIEAPPDFAGAVLVGLFASAVPQGAPLACRMLAGSGPFCLTAPPGRFHVYALAIRRPIEPLGLLMFDDALRASGGMIDVPFEAEPLRLSLRPREDFDPPILLTLPLLLARRRARQRSDPGTAEVVD